MQLGDRHEHDGHIFHPSKVVEKHIPRIVLMETVERVFTRFNELTWGKAPKRRAMSL